MGSQTLDILRQGIWASLTGGWYYDPYQNIFCNTFHLYLWLLLFCLPLIIYFYVPLQSVYIWTLYVTLITIVIGIIKYINIKLHKLFDTTECIEENTTQSLTLANTNSNNYIQSIPLTETNINANETEEGALGVTPEENIDLDDFDEVIELDNCDDKKNNENAEQKEKFYTKEVVSNNFKVDVHRKNSSSNSSCELNDIFKNNNNNADTSASQRNIKNTESKNDIISPGTSEEFCNNNNTAANCKSEQNIRQTDQRSNSIDLIVFSNKQKQYLKTIPSTSTTSAFELSNTQTTVSQIFRENEKGLMFWNRQHNEPSTSKSGSIIVNETHNVDDDFNFTLVKNNSEIVYPIMEKNEFTQNKQRDEEHSKNNSEDDEDEDDSKSPLIRKRNITSISMCSVDRTNSFNNQKQKLSKDDINSSTEKCSFDSIEKQSIGNPSFDKASFDSVDSSSIQKKDSSRNKSQSNSPHSSPVGSIPSIGLVSTKSPSVCGHDVECINEKRHVQRSFSCLSKGSDEMDKASLYVLKSIGSQENIECDRRSIESVKKTKSETQSQESIKSIGDKEKISSSIDFELDWLFEHTDSENEKIKEKCRHSATDENITKKKEKSSENIPGTSKQITKMGSRDGDDDDDDRISNGREIIMLNVKKKKRNRRDRRHNCRRSLHAYPSTSTAGPSNYKKSDVSRSSKSSRKLENFSVHDSFYKNQQQSEDDYDDDADDDVYERKMPNQDASGPSTINHKEMLQIFLASRTTKNSNENEVFSYRDDDSSMTSGLGSCISTSPVAINTHDMEHFSKMERHRSGRHSRTSTRHHRRHNMKHLSSRSHRRTPLIRNTTQPSSQQDNSSYQLTVPCGTHLAVSHNDTTEGAVHVFRDENGELMSYVFDEKGPGLAYNVRAETTNKLWKAFNNHQQAFAQASTSQQPTKAQEPTQGNEPSNNSSTSTSGENVCSRLLPTVLACSSAANVPITHLTQNANGSFVVESLLPHSRLHRHMNINNINPNTLRVIFSESSPTHLLENDLELVNVIRNRFHFMDSTDPPLQNSQEPKRYYQFPVFPFKNLKVRFNRLMLLSLLDHNFTLFYTFMCLLLTVMVAVFGSWMLYLNFYKDINVFIFCFVIAGCQYSMLKSVQPDASSPTHGFNKVIIFSRPVYFILISSLVLTLHYTVQYKKEWGVFSIYSIHCNPKEVLIVVKDMLVSFILFFPLIFSFGLFPQVNTFLMYFLEQLDIYLFGGNASCSVVSSLYCLFRSIISILLLFGFAYAGLSEPKGSQHILFSIYCGLVVATSYHLSRCASDPTPFWNIFMKYICPIDDIEAEKQLKIKIEQNKRLNRREKKTSSISRHEEEMIKDEGKNQTDTLASDAELHDPLPMKLISTVNARLKSDLIICLLVCIFVFGIHCSTVFSALQPQLNTILYSVTISLGIILHYLFPHLRKQLPWLCIARPVLKANEYSQYEVRNQAKIMWFEKLYVYLCFFERNIVYPVLFIASITYDAPAIASKFGLFAGSLILTTCALQCLRSSFSDPSSQYLVLCFSILLFRCDFSEQVSEKFLLDFCVTSIIYRKCYEFLLKIQFVVTYIAPWQITWGSAFHAFAQPFSVPHSAMMFLQAFISAVLSSPLYPFLGSAIFLTSYPRPVKFWERDYNTRRADHSNTRLITQFDRTLGSDDNNLNSIFYEHLTRSLQHSLCGDLLLGRWGSVSQGDCFVLASDYLNCLIHIVEIGNGLVTFQMRGLEFRGTYCQQREVEAISESVEDNDGCCCCEPGHLPNLLSLNAAFSQRWLAWEVTTTKYVLEGYSISEFQAASMLQVFDFRKVLITYYVRLIIYYTANASKLEEWLNNPTIIAALQQTLDKNFVDLDPVFNMNIDEDYDFRSSGITRQSFCSNYLDWIQFCANKRTNFTFDKSKDSVFVSLCFALCLLGRRTLGAASHNTMNSVEFFLYGLHALFKGDFRITCERDEWIFTDMDLLKKVISPAVKMSLKLHQDHFQSPDDYEDPAALYAAISQHQEKLVICHEGDPTWRNAVLSGTQSLLALRHVLDDGVDEYKVILLNKRYLSFRIIKMNRECVRGLWAGQQQELVYLRNRNPERGSIQNAKQALRNIINSSCDQPIGYPIFVSPLTTSYAETNEQLSSIVGGSLSLGVVKRAVMRFCRRIQRRCIEGCSSGGNVSHEDGGFGHDGVFMTTINIHAGYQGAHSIESNIMSGGSISRGNRSSLPSIGKPSSSTLASLAGLLSSNPSETSKHPNPSTTTIPSTTCEASGDTKDKDSIGSNERVRVIDPFQVHDALNLGRRIDVTWPDEKMRQRGGRTFWKDWLPEIGMEGHVVHKWVPNHRDPNKRSNVDRTILLIKIDDKYVPINESGVQNLVGEHSGETKTKNMTEPQEKPR